MEEISKLRIRCAMVIYEFERALARYVRDRKMDVASTGPGKEIVSRTLGSVGSQNKPHDVSFILENSYISEALQLAELVSNDTTHAPHFKRLKEVCDVLELFDIRNAVSHPNRHFPECYWYRCCALATDPAIDLLGLFEVSDVWGNAQSGKLEEPPEEWLS